MVGLAILSGMEAFSQDDLKTLYYNSASFVVPSSPAFELLPEKPSEVTHLVTGHDLSANLLPIIIGNSTLQQGVAFDGRPLIFLSGTLKDYQSSPLRRIAGRTILSFGTAPVASTEDMFVSAGIRIPLIDRGDPRCNEEYSNSIETAYAKALLEVQPPLQMDEEFLKARAKYASSKIEPLRTDFANKSWNAFRLDVGGALMYRAIESKFDNLEKNRYGLWAASSIPLSLHMQLLLSGKTSWIDTESDDQESNRTVIGSKLRLFDKNYKVGFSAELAYVWSTYSSMEDSNDSWLHYAAILELPIPKLNSYLGIALGFDGESDRDTDPTVEFRYAIYTDRLVKKD